LYETLEIRNFFNEMRNDEVGFNIDERFH